ncbi:MAG: aldo/keto reductase family protein [Phycisphaerales bacterium]|nr:aldo/keto reductase family protein [Phycisphaerales bacterium]
MNYRKLGKAGVKLSEVGLGSWLTYGKGVGDDASKACIRKAFDLGVNFFDTADVYHRGAAEEVFGRELTTFRRADLVIATKCFFPMSDGPNDRGLSRKHIFESVEASLKRLKTDYIDLYQCHRFDADVELFEVVRAMDDLIRQGKILYWGVSEWPALEIKNACAIARGMNACPPYSNQPEYSIAARRVETNGVQAVCVQEGLGMVVWSPLKQGLLSGKYSGGKVPADSRAASDKMNDFLREINRDVVDRVDRMKPIADRHRISLAQLAIAWLLKRAALTSIIIGATRVAQVEENCAACATNLTPDDMAEIDKLFPALTNP